MSLFLLVHGSREKSICTSGSGAGVVVVVVGREGEPLRSEERGATAGEARLAQFLASKLWMWKCGTARGDTRDDFHG